MKNLQELEEMKMNGNIQQEQQEWNYNDHQQHGEEETEELEENSAQIFDAQNYQNESRKVNLN
jgi:hypothetical protein